MKLKSILPTPTASVGTGLATVGIVYTAYNACLPASAIVQATDPYDTNLESARKKAAMQAVGIVSLVFLLTKDVTVLTLGGLATIAMDWNTRHALVMHPATGQVVTKSPSTPPLSAVN